MTLKEYEEKLNQAKQLTLEELKDMGENEFIVIDYQWRDDYDKAELGNLFNAFISFDDVLDWIKYIIEMPHLPAREEPIENRIYFRIEKRLKKENFVDILVKCQLNAKGEIMQVYGFGGDSNRLDEICRNNSLFRKYLNVELPYKTGDILKINCIPYRREPIYVVYGGNLKKDNYQDDLQYYCIYDSEGRLNIESLCYPCKFGFYCPMPVLNHLELVENAPNEKLSKFSKLLKDSPDVWWEIAEEHKELESKRYYLNKWIENGENQ